MAEKVEQFRAALRDAVELPAELAKDRGEVVAKIDDWLGEVDESMRRWMWLSTLEDYVRRVQTGLSPQPVNTKGGDQKVTMAVQTLRNAVRLVTQGATIEDMIAPGSSSPSRQIRVHKRPQWTVPSRA